jgi:hypothetical protein
MGKHVTLIMVGSATGEMALPFFIASYIGEVVDGGGGGGNTTRVGGRATTEDPNEGKNPLVLMVVITTASVGMISLLLVLITRGVRARALKPGEGARDEPEPRAAGACEGQCEAEVVR